MLLINACGIKLVRETASFTSSKYVAWAKARNGARGSSGPKPEAGIWVTDGAPSLSLQEKEGFLGHFPTGGFREESISHNYP